MYDELVKRLRETSCGAKDTLWWQAADVVPVGAYIQVAWERDTAIEQLKQIGKSFGEQMDDVRPVVRGKWQKVGQLGVIVVCSVCRKSPDRKTNFCPNCGADMREKQT